MATMLGLSLMAALLAGFTFGDDFSLSLRRRKPPPAPNGETEPIHETVRWNATQTAFIVCDMWDRHWCAGASSRVDELAPAMNAVLCAGRERGVLVVHAPSDIMPFYENTPQRERAKSAPQVASTPANIHLWRPLDPTMEPPLPIDDSDGGCDDLPPCPTYRAWTRQHPALIIEAEDAVSDQGAEIFRLLEQRQIENIIVMGVHTNMCVLGRSFSIRRLISLGRNVALVRDMTDSLYNPRQRPFVNHFRGTELVVNHIETYWCPSITSDQITGGQAFRFRNDAS